MPPKWLQKAEALVGLVEPAGIHVGCKRGAILDHERVDAHVANTTLARLAKGARPAFGRLKGNPAHQVA